MFSNISACAPLYNRSLKHKSCPSINAQVDCLIAVLGSCWICCPLKPVLAWTVLLPAQSWFPSHAPSVGGVARNTPTKLKQAGGEADGDWHLL